MLRVERAFANWIGLPRRRQSAGGDFWQPLYLTEVRSVSRNAPLTIAFLGNLLLVPILLYLLYFRKGPKDLEMLLSGTALLVSIPAINYASYCFAKDGYSLQGYMTRLTVRAYVRWKVYFLRTYSLLFWVVLLPPVLRGGTLVIAAYVSFALYYAGFGGPLMLYVATFNRSKIDLRGSPFFTSQHTPWYAVLFVLPVTTPFFVIDGMTVWALGATAVVGLAGLAFTGRMTTVIVKNLFRKKHQLLDL